VEATHEGHDHVIILGSGELVGHAGEHLFFTRRDIRTSTLILGVINNGEFPGRFDSARSTNGGSYHVESLRSNVDEGLLEDFLVVHSWVESLSSAVGNDLNHSLRSAELQHIGVVMAHGCRGDILEHIKVSVSINIGDEVSLRILNISEEAELLVKVASDLAVVFDCLLLLGTREGGHHFRSEGLTGNG